MQKRGEGISRCIGGQFAARLRAFSHLADQPEASRDHLAMVKGRDLGKTAALGQHEADLRQLAISLQNFSTEYFKDPGKQVFGR